MVEAASIKSRYNLMNNKQNHFISEKLPTKLPSNIKLYPFYPATEIPILRELPFDLHEK